MVDLHEQINSNNISYFSNQTSLNKKFRHSSQINPKLLAKKILLDLNNKILAAEKTADNMHDMLEYDASAVENYEDPFDARIKELKRSKKRFIDIIRKGPPENYEFVAVLEHPMLDYKKLRCTEYEYLKHVRKDFVKYIAEHEREELKRRGISEYEISRMKETGEYLSKAFPYGPDHVLERANSSILSTEKAIDPNNPRSNREVLKINHFNNLRMIPNSIHELKNNLKDIQISLHGDFKKPRLFLMLVPKDNPNEPKSYLAKEPRKDSIYYRRPLSNGEVINETLEFLSHKPIEEIKTSETCQHALNNVAEEIEKRIKKASDKSLLDDKMHKDALKRLFANNHLKTLYIKLSDSEHPFVERLTEDIKTARKILFTKKKKYRVKTAPKL